MADSSSPTRMAKLPLSPAMRTSKKEFPSRASSRFVEDGNESVPETPVRVIRKCASSFLSPSQILDKIKEERDKLESKLLSLDHDLMQAENDEIKHIELHGTKEEKKNFIKNKKNKKVAKYGLNRVRSFTVNGMTKEEVEKQVIKTRSHHARTVEESSNKILKLKHSLTLLEEPHEETFYELFYDLILAVVFIKLGYLKYDLTSSGLLTVATLFFNFYSCWNLLNTYITMMHQEDAFHRCYYIAHITTSFLMAISIQNPEFDCFSMQYMAFYHAASSIMCRTVTLLMYCNAYLNADKIFHIKDKHSINEYTVKDIKSQFQCHIITLLISICIFSSTMMPWWFNHSSNKNNDDNNDDNNNDDNSGHNINLTLVYIITSLWFLAIIIEQFGNNYACIYMKLPFSAIYAGERMEAWLMLCFGESVIALLIEPVFYDPNQLGGTIAAFIMMLCICIAYFDIVDADQFLHLLIQRNEKLKAFCFISFQSFFSFCIFLVGVSLKTLVYITQLIYELEINTGCNLGHHHEAKHIRKKLLQLNSHDDQNDNVEIQNQNFENNEINNDNHIFITLFYSLSQFTTSFFSSLSSSLSSSSLSLSQSNSMNHKYFIESSQNEHRRLNEWGVQKLDDLLFRCFIMLTISATLAMVSAVLIGYSMPSSLSKWRIHSSRIGSMIIASCTISIPFFLKNVATECLLNFADDDANSYTSSNLGYLDLKSRYEYLSITKGLVYTSFVIMLSFMILLIGSLDINREITYARLEEAARCLQNKQHIIASRNHSTNSTILSSSQQSKKDEQKKEINKKGDHNEVDVSSSESIEELKHHLARSLPSNSNNNNNNNNNSSNSGNGSGSSGHRNSGVVLGGGLKVDPPSGAASGTSSARSSINSIDETYVTNSLNLDHLNNSNTNSNNNNNNHYKSNEGITRDLLIRSLTMDESSSRLDSVHTPPPVTNNNNNNNNSGGGSGIKHKYFNQDDNDEKDDLLSHHVNSQRNSRTRSRSPSRSPATRGGDGGGGSARSPPRSRSRTKGRNNDFIDTTQTQQTQHHQTSFTAPLPYEIQLLQQKPLKSALSSKSLKEEKANPTISSTRRISGSRGGGEGTSLDFGISEIETDDIDSDSDNDNKNVTTPPLSALSKNSSHSRSHSVSNSHNNHSGNNNKTRISFSPKHIRNRNSSNGSNVSNSSILKQSSNTSQRVSKSTSFSSVAITHGDTTTISDISNQFNDIDNNNNNEPHRKLSLRSPSSKKQTSFSTSNGRSSSSSSPPYYIEKKISSSSLALSHRKKKKSTPKHISNHKVSKFPPNSHTNSKKEKAAIGSGSRVSSHDNANGEVFDI